MDLSHSPIAKIWVNNCDDRFVDTSTRGATMIGATSNVGRIMPGDTISITNGITTPGASNDFVAIKHFVTLIANTPGATSWDAHTPNTKIPQPRTK